MKCINEMFIINKKLWYFDVYIFPFLSQDCLPQPGRVAIVTGGSRGIGVEVVKMFLELDMEVIIGKFKN